MGLALIPKHERGFAARPRPEQKSPMLAVTEVRISRWRGDWLPTGGDSRGRGRGGGLWQRARVR